MKVELISYTPDALTLLLKTKGTRLTHQDDPATWSEEKRKEHLEYMRDTIKSSWEFVDAVFKIDGVTRAFTHQRTTHGLHAPSIADCSSTSRATSPPVPSRSRTAGSRR